MKKMVLTLDLHDDKAKQKAMSKVSGLAGVNSISMDMKDKKLTLTGDVDPVVVVRKLRKLCHTEILSVGPPEKKKEEPKKEEPKKEEPKKADEKKKDPNDVSELVKAYKAYNPYMTTYYHVRSVEEDPNACVIC